MKEYEKLLYLHSLEMCTPTDLTCRLRDLKKETEILKDSFSAEEFGEMIQDIMDKSEIIYDMFFVISSLRMYHYTLVPNTLQIISRHCFMCKVSNGETETLFIQYYAQTIHGVQEKEFHSIRRYMEHHQEDFPTTANFNIYYATTNNKIHMHPTSFLNLTEAQKKLGAYRALKNIIALCLRNPFSGQVLYSWDIYNGLGRFNDWPKEILPQDDYDHRAIELGYNSENSFD